ncbi:hypothetical protein OEA41_000153 [Lepraria neglecta]|uniref:LD-carboxypeptidase N-terminal domain-containing protein n=1 Tax=Lepraria neglecta TaxID=209136 RepID=A0AAD9ZFC0_9LECA|nr:hypothetical protein OEA41_000153 [Lepraria neglecta]
MAMELIIPKALQKGDTIAFVSPSARVNQILPTPIERGKSYLEHLGYHVQIIFNTSETKTLRDSLLQRCEEIHEAFKDPDIKAIICTVGGSTANELLPHLDYVLIKSNPKIFCGYSDITLLHTAIFTQTGLQTFYGPNVIPEFGEVFQFTTEHFRHVLQGSPGKAVGPVPRSSHYAEKLPDFFFGNETSQVPRELSPSPTWTWLRSGAATG